MYTSAQADGGNQRQDVDGGDADCSHNISTAAEHRQEAQRRPGTGSSTCSVMVQRLMKSCNAK